MPQPKSVKRVLIQYLPENVSIDLVHVAVAGSKIEIFYKAQYKTYLDTSAASSPWMIKMSDTYGGNPYQRRVDMPVSAKTITNRMM